MIRSHLVDYDNLGPASSLSEKILEMLQALNPDLSRILWYAVRCSAIYKEMHLAEIGTPSYRDTLYYKGYQLYAAALGYLWNNWFEEAFEAEQHFIKQELWDDFEIGIHAYLSVLIIKKQTAHLDELFKDDAFKEKFIAHYEVFISLLVNPDYRVTQSWMILTPIINKIRETESQHGLQKIL